MMPDDLDERTPKADPVSQRKEGKFTVVRIDAQGVTDKIVRLTWEHAVDLFALNLKREDKGCKWEIICPDGMTGAEAEF